MFFTVEKRTKKLNWKCNHDWKCKYKSSWPRLFFPEAQTRGISTSHDNSSNWFPFRERFTSWILRCVDVCIVRKSAFLFVEPHTVHWPIFRKRSRIRERLNTRMGSRVCKHGRGLPSAPRRSDSSPFKTAGKNPAGTWKNSSGGSARDQYSPRWNFIGGEFEACIFLARRSGLAFHVPLTRYCANSRWAPYQVAWLNRRESMESAKNTDPSRRTSSLIGKTATASDCYFSNEWARTYARLASVLNPLATVGAYRRLEILRLWYWERL